MTQNQIRYSELKENERANRAKEEELNRSNLANEGENYRSHRANEAETKRANLRREALTAQSNQINKDLGYANVNQRENQAHLNYNLGVKSLNSEDWARRAQAGETQRANLAREKENYRANVSREAEDTRSAMTRERETQRHNLVEEDRAARELAVNSLLKLPMSLKTLTPTVTSLWKMGGNVYESLK